MPPREYRSRAIVLRSFDQGESDRVVHLYTREVGRVSAIAKGARRSKRRFPGTLELFSVLDVRLVDPPRSALMRLEGARLVRAFESMTRSLPRYAIGCRFLELVDRLTPEQEAQPGFFEFCEGLLGVLDEEPGDRLLAALVLAKTLARLGYRPVLERCAACGRDLATERARVAFVPAQGGAVCSACAGSEACHTRPELLAALESGLRMPLRERAGLGLGPADVRRLERHLDHFFRFYIGFELRSDGFLRTVLDAVDGAAAPGDTAPARAAQGGPVSWGGGEQAAGRLAQRCPPALVADEEPGSGPG